MQKSYLHATLLMCCNFMADCVMMIAMNNNSKSSTFNADCTCTLLYEGTITHNNVVRPQKTINLNCYKRRAIMSGYRRNQGPLGGAEHLARIHGTEEDKVSNLRDNFALINIFCVIFIRLIARSISRLERVVMAIDVLDNIIVHLSAKQY